MHGLTDSPRPFSRFEVGDCACQSPSPGAPTRWFEKSCTSYYCFNKQRGTRSPRRAILTMCRIINEWCKETIVGALIASFHGEQFLNIEQWYHIAVYVKKIALTETFFL